MIEVIITAYVIIALVAVLIEEKSRGYARKCDCGICQWCQDYEFLCSNYGQWTMDISSKKDRGIVQILFIKEGGKEWK